MFRISRFQQLLQGVPRGSLQSIVEKRDGDRYAKSFGCSDLLTVQVFAHLSGSRSLREVEAGFNAHRSHHYHLGTRAVRRATLADACARRDPEVFADLAKVLMNGVHRRVRREINGCLRLLDSTSFTLKGLGFDDWTAETRTGHTQGLKLHVLFDPACSVPLDGQITAANVNDVSQAFGIDLESDATYVFDKGYCAYNWWAQIDECGAKFVTRLKANARITVQEQRPVTADGVLADEIIVLSNRNPGAGRRNRYTTPLRRVTIERPGKTPLLLVTNDCERSATEIGNAYKARWQIELFFKWIKQNLRIKRFLGRSENAVRIQILCALIAYLLVALLQSTHARGKSLLRMMNELRAGLFQRPDVDDEVERRRERRSRELAAMQGGLFLSTFPGQ